MDTTETTLFTAVLISSIIAFILLVYFACWMYGNHRKYFASLRLYYLQEVDLLEQERSRMARDMHDDLGQLLSAVHMFVRNSAGITAEDNRRLQKAGDLLKDATQRMGDISKNLRPAILEEKGLEEAIRQLMQHYQYSTGIQFLLDYQVDRVLTGQFALHIYRMIQELLHNAVKHSEGSKVVVVLHEQKEYVYLLYRDDGKGMPLQPQRNGAGSGNLQSRTLLLNGKMRINSRAGNGTEYFFTFPLSAHESF
jgi:two-component system, NarL family, sensor kinase